MVITVLMVNCLIIFKATTMKEIQLKMIDPNDFEVIRVISFTVPHLEYGGIIVYRRPLTTTYKEDCPDEFDESLLKWLQQFNLKDVVLSHSKDILFDNQLKDYQQIYDGGRPTTQLLLTCHGDYTIDELMVKGKIDARIIELPIYWNSLAKTSLPDVSGVVTFDKEKEQYYFDTISKIKSLK